jgi:hypothetical protein
MESDHPGAPTKQKLEPTDFIKTFALLISLEVSLYFQLL